MLPFGRIWYIYNLHYEKFADGTVKCIEDEIPFELPEGWGWCRLQTICEKEIKRGKAPKYVEKSGTLVFAQKCNTKKGKINITLAQYLDESTLHKYSPDLFTRYNDIIINSTGTGTLGRIGIFEESDDLIKLPIVPDSHITTVRAFSINVAKYVYLFLKANQPYFENSGEGSTNQKELRPEVIKTFLMAIPPYKEQEKIVEKFEAVCTIIDLLDAYTEDYNQAIKSIKSKILDLAIRGKLVPQDPNDEPASVLLERIRAEKEELIRQGKIKRDKKESIIFKGEDNSYYEKIGEKVSCIDDELPFDIPESWSWIRFGNIVINYDSQRRPITKHNRVNVFGLYDYFGATGAIDKVDSYIFDGEYLMIGEDGGNFFTQRDNSFIASGKFWANNHVHIVQPIVCNIWYLKHFLDSCDLALMGLITGIGVPKLNQENMNKILVPIPPIEEQDRIAFIVKEIYSVISNIEKSLS